MNFISMDKRSLGFFLFALVLTNVLLYWPDARMGYVLDDVYVIAQNPMVKQAAFQDIWQSGLFSAANRSLDSRLNYYRPVLTSSFALEYKIWGSNPFAQRIVNVLIHLANSVLVFLLFCALFKKPQLAVLGALFFSMLPVHEWSVRYILGRGDLLAAFFSLLSLLCLCQFIANAKKMCLWGSLLFFVAAMLSKETALLNVGLVFLITFYLTKDFKKIFAVGSFFGIAGVAYYLIRLKFYPIHAGSVSGTGQVLAGLKEALEYSLRFLMPWSAQQLIPNGGGALGLLWAVCCFGLLSVGVTRAKDRSDVWKSIVFGVIWIAVGLAVFVVTCRISSRLGPVLSEHFLYFAAVGFVLLLAVMIEHISNHLFRRILFCGFVFYFLMVSSLNGFYWKSEEKLLRHVQKLENKKWTAAFEQLAMRYDDNVQNIFQLIDRAPSSSTQSLWLRRLGDIYRKEKNYPDAKSALARAVDLNPRNIEAINELAVCHLETGEIDEGMKLLAGSVLISSRQSDAFRLLGIVLYRNNQFAQAIQLLKKACAADPDQVEAALHLMMAYFFVNDQVSYLESVDRISDRFGSSDMVLRFAAAELFAHGYFKETFKIITQFETIFLKDPAMKAMLEESRSRISTGPK